MFVMLTFRCQSCDREVELRGEHDDDRVARVAVRSWRCLGCGMHAHGRPSLGAGGVSGLPLWLADQFWTAATVLADPPFREHLYTIVREALAGAAGEVPADDVVSHAEAILVRVACGLRSPLVPSHPNLDTVLAAAEGAAGMKHLWSPFVERHPAGRLDVTFQVRPRGRAGMFAFQYQSTVPATLRLHTCYTIWRTPPRSQEE